MTQNDIRHEIQHRLLMLEYTMRLVANPPADDLSKMMLSQAERIRNDIEELKKLLKQKKGTNKRKAKKGRK